MGATVFNCKICGSETKRSRNAMQCPVCGAIYPIDSEDSLSGAAAELAGEWRETFREHLKARRLDEAEQLTRRLMEADPADSELHAALEEVECCRQCVIVDGVLVKYNGSAPRVILPEGIDAIGEKAFEKSRCEAVIVPEGVTAIRQGAFRDCARLKSVSLPSSLTVIGNSAFKGCRALAELNLPGNLTEIGSYAFSGCAGLSALSLPEGMKLIGYRAFYNCSGVTSVSLPRRLRDVRKEAFVGCARLTHVTWPGHNVRNDPDSPFHGTPAVTGAAAAGGAAASSGGGTSSSGASSSGASSGSPPSWSARVAEARSTMSVGGSGRAFTGSSHASGSGSGSGASTAEPFIIYSGTLAAYTGSDKRITIPSGVTRIGDSAFKDSKCVEVILPKGLLEIGKNSFCNCRELTGIKLPGSLHTIGEYAFSGCTKLKAVNLPIGLTKLGEGAFRNCTMLVSVQLPVKLRNPEAGAFEGCTSLNTVTIPYGVNSISTRMFKGTALGEVELPGSIGAVASEAFAGCVRLWKVVLPDSLPAVGPHAFDRCPALTHIEWPGHSIIRDSIEAFSDTPAAAEARATDWRLARRCQHCGGVFKGFIFKRCIDCGQRKDY